ncbi:MAG: GNAT family acetyltransferase [Boseongicola sp. SB0664_bin_43]|uniref:GNAT family acetyltransferase n=1 Tax=Boseongicola sp. SB0664_bin_43 TaxID=2604844 RepID=A0A6B0XZ05_9RHOB|nr:GNAT family acetyltransferase [Boseongicola sp. SB0664_bin_43]MYK32407.1 GNAT family acetyltransferase [Boseongicola sp. SB0670_bin_30]
MPGSATYGTSRGGKEFAIRQIRGGEEEAVAELWHACGLTRSWNDPLDDIASARTNVSSEIFVATTGHGDDIAGSVMAGYDGHRGWVYYVAVAPECREQQLGKRLMHHAESWLRNLGARKVMLMIRGDNAEVRRFYEGLGYGIEERTIMSCWIDKRR